MIIVGVLSGTSADGIDAAVCEINGAPPQLETRIIGGVSVPFAAEMRERILRACDIETGRVDEICRLNAQLGDLFADAAVQAIEAAGLAAVDVGLIASHGQTVWHDVSGDQVIGTLQIGEAAVIAERTGITTVSNFRTRDVAAGGQGAPLTAYVDWLLLRHAEKWRAVQNIGGMGNVTFLPPLSDDGSARPLAFDTGPGNVLIDAAVSFLTDNAQTYDTDGKLAMAGRVDLEWLSGLREHEYFSRTPPKTTGRELFGRSMGEKLAQEGRARGLLPEDIIATLTELTAITISDAYSLYAPAHIDEVILGGGGARNPALVRMLRAAMPDADVKTHEDVGLDSDFKEALVFAVLAHEAWHGRTGTLPALTGASHATITGSFTPGDNFPSLVG